MSDFHGFPVAALDFYDDLESDNSKTFWTAHKSTYEDDVRAPMVSMLAELKDEFGAAKIFRPYRDVRFAKDKTPYKTHQGAFISTGRSTGWYVQIDASGVRVGAGFYHAAAEDLGFFRRAIDDERHGRALARILTTLTKQGWDVGGEQLKRPPRGYDADHPRIDLLRHKSLTLQKNYGFEPFIHTADLLSAVRADWQSVRPFIDWVTRNATG